MRGCCLAWAMVCAAPLFAAGWPQIRVTSVFSGARQPTHIAAVPGGDGRLWVLEQAGRIRVARNGVLAQTPVLDITSRVSCCGERGLLGVAFPPGFATKRYFYVNYTNLAGNTVIARYRLTGDDTADAASETVVLGIDQPFANHNGGQVTFGPDGFLYIGMGDGGSAGDPFGNGQSLSALLGKILRIDVESGTQPYAVPPSNPFVGRAGARGEIWAYGLRNPWRFSFDRATGDLYIADVGQDRWEEVDFQPASSRGGENYGWNIMEGAHCFSGLCTSQGLVLPVAEYGHDLGCSITGGFVYRGQRYPALRGIYFYGDYCSGRIWGLRPAGTGWESQVLLDTGLAITSFGEDEAGEIYIADQGGDAVYMLAGPEGPQTGVTAVTNAASFEVGITPGSIAAISGTGIVQASGAASSFPLPTAIAGTTVSVNGTPAPLFAVAQVGGRQQINIQAPWSLAGAAAADVVVTTNGAASAPMRVSVLPVQPGLFTLPDGAQAAALHAADYSLVQASNPAARGEVVLLYGTGFGAVENQPQTGAATPVSPLAYTQSAVAVTMGGSNAEVLFSGLAPGLAGVYQLNVRVPAGAATGALDVVASAGGRSSPAVKLPVR